MSARWFAALAVTLAACSSGGGTSSAPSTTEATPTTTAEPSFSFSRDTALALTDCYREAQKAGKGPLDYVELALAVCEEAQAGIVADHVPDGAEPETATEANLRHLTAALRQGIFRAESRYGVTDDDAKAIREATKKLKAEAGEYL